MNRAVFSEGAGMNSTFIGGVICALILMGIYFENMVGASGGGCCNAYAALKQFEIGMRIWLELIPGIGRLIGLRGFKTEEFERIFRIEAPLSLSELANVKSRIWIALSDLRTRGLILKSLNDSADPMGLLVSSVTMPFFSKPVQFGDSKCFDANLACSMPLVGQAVDILRQADEVFIILGNPKGARKKEWFWNLISNFFLMEEKREMLRGKASLENSLLRDIDKGIFPREIGEKKIIVIRPDKPLPGFINNNKLALARSMNIGIDAGLEAVRRMTFKS